MYKKMRLNICKNLFLCFAKLVITTTKNSPQNNSEADSQTEEKSTEIPKCIYLKKRQQIIDNLRLI